MSTSSTGSMQLQSSAFSAGGMIPREHTCDGADRSPPLSWTEPPAGTKSLVLIMHDPDAPRGDFTHWVLYNLPAQTRQLDAGLPGDAQLPNGARQGRTDFGRTGYGGPCPPPGPAHRYLFQLSALDTMLDLAPGASRAQVEAAMRGHVLAQGELMGRYARG